MPQQTLELFDELLNEAVDCATIPSFMHYSTMTTAHAERSIISLLKENVLYKYNGRLIAVKFGRLNYVFRNKVGGIRFDLSFSPKHICRGIFKAGELRDVKDRQTLHYVLTAICNY